MELLPSSDTSTALSLTSLLVVTGMSMARDWCPPINVIRRADDPATTDDARLGYIAAAGTTVVMGGALTVFTQAWAPLLLGLIAALAIVGVHEYAIQVHTDAPLQSM